MTELEYRICKRIQAGEISNWQMLPAAEQALVTVLNKRGLLRMDFAGMVVLKPEGVAALLAHEEELDRLENEAKQHAQEQAQEKAEKAADIRRAWVQFWLGLVLGWLLGGITFKEVCQLIMKVIAWVGALFHG